MCEIEFKECSNYRGALQAKEMDGKYYWKVDCSINDQEWLEIPEYLWEALSCFHIETKTNKDMCEG